MRQLYCSSKLLLLFQPQLSTNAAFQCSPHITSYILLRDLYSQEWLFQKSPGGWIIERKSKPSPIPISLDLSHKVWVELYAGKS